MPAYRFSKASAKLKALAEAEAGQRPSLLTYPDRTSLSKIPLLTIDVEHYECERQLTGIWCLNQGPFDQFSSEFMELATSLGKGMQEGPRVMDPLTFLLHNLSLYLWQTEDPHRTHFPHLRLLMKPLPNGGLIQVRQIVSLIKATELYARRLATLSIGGRPLFEAEKSPAPPWQLVGEANYRSGVQYYPKYVEKPDGCGGIVSTREEHARLFTEDWLTKGIVTTLANKGGDPKVREDELAPPRPTALVISKNKPGPEPDVKNARKVAEIVAREAPSQRWQNRLDDICKALDKDEIPCPKTWVNREPPILGWSDVTTPHDRELAKKAIAHHLAIARKL